MKSERYLGRGLLFALLVLHGCSTAAMVGTGAGAGLGTYSYIKGELTAEYPYPFDQTWNASLTALDRLEIEVTVQERDAFAGKIRAKRADGKSVVLRIENKGLGVTAVGVRVGTFGNQEASRKIHRTILNSLEG